MNYIKSFFYRQNYTEISDHPENFTKAQTSYAHQPIFGSAATSGVPRQEISIVHIQVKATAEAKDGILPVPLLLSANKERDAMRLQVLNLYDFCNSSVELTVAKKADDIFHTHCKISSLCISGEQIFFGSNLGKIAVWDFELLKSVNDMGNRYSKYQTQSLTYNERGILSASVDGGDSSENPIEEIKATKLQNDQQCVVAKHQGILFGWKFSENEALRDPAPTFKIQTEQGFGCFCFLNDSIAIGLNSGEIVFYSTDGEQLNTFQTKMHTPPNCLHLTPESCLIIAYNECIIFGKFDDPSKQVYDLAMQNIENVKYIDFGLNATGQVLYMGTPQGMIYVTDTNFEEVSFFSAGAAKPLTAIKTFKKELITAFEDGSLSHHKNS